MREYTTMRQYEIAFATTKICREWQRRNAHIGSTLRHELDLP